MTNKWFKVVKIAATVLSIGSTILSMYVDGESSKREIAKLVGQAAAKKAKEGH